MSPSSHSVWSTARHQCDGDTGTSFSLGESLVRHIQMLIPEACALEVLRAQGVGRWQLALSLLKEGFHPPEASWKPKELCRGFRAARPVREHSFCSWTTWGLWHVISRQ